MEQRRGGARAHSHDGRERVPAFRNHVVGPIGSEQFVSEKLQDHIEEDRRLWQAIPNVPNLQCGWQTLLQSANPRANHTLRTLPPAMSADCASAHDEGLWETAHALLEGDSTRWCTARERHRITAHEDGRSRVEVCGPLCTRCKLCRMGRCVACDRTEESAVEDVAVESMSSHEESGEECLDEPRARQTVLTEKDSGGDPVGPYLRVGSRPETHAEGEDGGWRHRWQYWSSSTSDSHFGKGTMLSGRTVARRAFLRSRSGRNAGAKAATPQLEACGHHRASCPRSGRVKKRATPTDDP